ncbi:hypothetical protein GAYE_SCF7681MG7016 [Galdieria yellowstonensis]|uniref:VTT domain-containing protein n=1 Tax=Galdieria yellowstonensis TaxID=3028027 RepID=A0AAV9IPI8_9RHOD|nr:hypothetical protein GAYE_SCF7681MG7016 [Galdieria yellowstonensis]
MLLPGLLVTSLIWSLVSMKTIEQLEDWWWSAHRKHLRWLWYYLAYVGFGLIGFPAAVWTLGAGYLFGPWKGAMITVTAMTTIALVAFGLSRYVFYSFFYDVAAELWSKRQLEQWNGVMTQRGFLMTLLFRCSPLFPFTWTSFLLGITPVPIVAFLLASCIGTLPEVIFLTHMGSLASSLVEIVETNSSPMASFHRRRWYVLILGLVFSALVVYIITRIAKQTLEQQQSQSPFIATSPWGEEISTLDN